MQYWYKVTKEHKMFDKKALKETIKSFLRGGYFTLLGLVGTFITSLVASQDLQNTVIHIADDIYLPVGAFLVFVLGLVAKGIDRYIHTNDKISLTGITPADLLDR